MTNGGRILSWKDDMEDDIRDMVDAYHRRPVTIVDVTPGGLDQIHLEDASAVEYCVGRRRSIFFRDRLARVVAPNMVFVCNYPSTALRVARRNSNYFYNILRDSMKCLAFIEDGGEWYLGELFHVSPSGIICFDNATMARIVNRLVYNEPLKLAELYWCSGFAADYDQSVAESLLRRPTIWKKREHRYLDTTVDDGWVEKTDTMRVTNIKQWVLRV